MSLKNAHPRATTRGLFISLQGPRFSTGIRAIVTCIKILSVCLLLQLWGCTTVAPQLGSTPKAIPQKAHNIALFVPLTGANAEHGRAIQNGFMAAYYYAKQTLPNPPSIRVVDTSTGDITGLYDQAVAKGADFIVGPLTKPEVQKLATHFLTVPVLALNTLANGSRVDRLYQFGLSPQDEAEQVAVRAKQDGHSNALVIVPTGQWGTDVSNAFIRKWQSLGGSVAGNIGYPSAGNLSPMLKSALSKGGMDMVFLAAFPNDARQMNPMIKFYKPGLPVYATSLIYSGTSSPLDHDLDGIMFVDMPWILGPDTTGWSDMRSYIQTSWANSYARMPRFYAFGIDAYHLTYTLDQLSSGVSGTTGKLTVDGNQQIHRELEWGKFEDGVVKR